MEEIPPGMEEMPPGMEQIPPGMGGMPHDGTEYSTAHTTEIQGGTKRKLARQQVPGVKKRNLQRYARGGVVVFAVSGSVVDYSGGGVLTQQINKANPVYMSCREEGMNEYNIWYGKFMNFVSNFF